MEGWWIILNRIKFRVLVVGVASDGRGGYTESYSEDSVEWGKVWPVRSSPTVVATVEGSIVTHKGQFRAGAASSIVEGVVLESQDDSNRFMVMAVNLVGSRRHRLEVDCVEYQGAPSTKVGE